MNEAGLVVTAVNAAERDPPPAAPERRPYISEDRAARSLRWRRKDAVAWMRKEGLSVVADGRRVVASAALAARLTGPPPAPPLEPRSRRTASATAARKAAGRVGTLPGLD